MTTAHLRPEQRALAVLTVLAVTQDAIHGLVFLSYMNHYLLDVLEASPGLPGYTLAIHGGTKLVIHPLAGRLLDRSSPRTLLAASLACGGAAVAVLLTFHTLAGFLVATVLLAANSAGMWPLVYDALARTQPRGSRAGATGLLTIAGYGATGAGFVAGVLLSGFAPWRAAFVATGVLVAAPLLCLAARAFDRGEAAAVVRDSHPPPSPGGRRAGLVVFGLVVFLDYAAISSLAGIYGPYTRRTLDLSLPQTTLLLIPAGLAALGSLALSARFSRPGRRFAEMAALYALAAGGALGLAATSSPALAAVVAVPLAAGAGGIGPIVAATVLDLSGRSGRGLVIGSLMSVEGLGSVLGPAAVAGAADLGSPRAGLAVVGVTFALLLLVTGIAARRAATP